MNDELSVMIRDTAREEAAAAEHEFPLSPDALDRFVGHVRRRRAAGVAILAAAGVLVGGAAVLGLTQLWNVAPVPPIASPTTSLSPSPTPSPQASPSPSVDPSPAPTATTPTPITTTPPPPPPKVTVPAAVSGLSAGPGGGSGEIVVHWTGTPDATGYRVYRTSAPGGSMTRSASYSIATGATTVEYGGTYEFIGIWSYSPNSFEYVEVVNGQPGYFVVAAFNSAGEGPRRGPVCAVPLGSSGTC